MVKHMIIWNLKEEFQGDEKKKIMEGIKEGLEGLKDKIPGLLEIKVYIGNIESSTGDLMLDSTFESPKALKDYGKHPAHQEVANTKVRPYTASRACLDFEV